jgi:hypothetical protein
MASKRTDPIRAGAAWRGAGQDVIPDRADLGGRAGPAHRIGARAAPAPAAAPGQAPPPPDAPYLATAPARPGDRRAAFAIALLSALVLAVVAPIAAEPWAPVPAFIPAYQSAAAVNDLVRRRCSSASSGSSARPPCSCSAAATC